MQIKTVLFELIRILRRAKSKIKNCTTLHVVGAPDQISESSSGPKIESNSRPFVLHRIKLRTEIIPVEIDLPTGTWRATDVALNCLLAVLLAGHQCSNRDQSQRRGQRPEAVPLLPVSVTTVHIHT